MSSTVGNTQHSPASATARGARLSNFTSPEKPPATLPTRPWYLSTIGLALLGSALMWAAFPPLDVGMLGWVAPICWLVLVRREHLDGKRPYRNILLAGFVFWLAALWWLVLPHWAGSVGLVALSAYLALYTALFILLSRVAVHRFHIPSIVAAPVIWTGLELARARLMTGFLMASLAHTQYRWTEIIQISDLAGAYGVSFLVMLVAACVARMLPIERHRFAVWPLAIVVASMAAALTYGYWRLGAWSPAPTEVRYAPKIAVIQGNIKTEFGGDPEEKQQEIHDEYMPITQRALAEHPDIQLVVWPESMYWKPYFVIEPGAWLPATFFTDHPKITPEIAQQAEQQGKLPERLVDEGAYYQETLRDVVAKLVEPLKPAAAVPSSAEPAKAGPSFLFGMDTVRFTPGKLRRYSSSVYVNNTGEIVGTYHKMHPVIFGEYVPLGEHFPWLYALTPLPGGLSVGDGPTVFRVGDVNVAPNICYETVMPHLIRAQVATLRAAGHEPDVLITQTNDGWYQGSSALDMHMVCSVFRAVECRKPTLLAANTGISAVIDGNGRILSRLAAGEQSYLLSEVPLDGRSSPYVRFGDTLGVASAVACGLLLAAALTGRIRRRPQNSVE